MFYCELDELRKISWFILGFHVSLVSSVILLYLSWDLMWTQELSEFPGLFISWFVVNLVNSVRFNDLGIQGLMWDQGAWWIFLNYSGLWCELKELIDSFACIIDRECTVCQQWLHSYFFKLYMLILPYVFLLVVSLCVNHKDPEIGFTFSCGWIPVLSLIMFIGYGIWLPIADWLR